MYIEEGKEYEWNIGNICYTMAIGRDIIHTGGSANKSIGDLINN